MLLGISGYARSGKTEAALSLDGFTHFAFADGVRSFAERVDPLIKAEDGSVERLSVLLPLYQGWEGLKSSMWGDSGRRLLQDVGETARVVFGPNAWRDRVFRNLENYPNVVISDVRYPNEAEGIRRRGGYVIRINRPGVGPANGHRSETNLDHWPFDAVISNDGDLADLSRWIRNTVEVFEAGERQLDDYLAEATVTPR